MKCVVHSPKGVSPDNGTICGVCRDVLRLRLSHCDTWPLRMAEKNSRVKTAEQRAEVMKLHTMFVTREILEACK